MRDLISQVRAETAVDHSACMCSQCGHLMAQWRARCPKCTAWTVPSSHGAAHPKDIASPIVGASYAQKPRDLRLEQIDARAAMDQEGRRRIGETYDPEADGDLSGEMEDDLGSAGSIALTDVDMSQIRARICTKIEVLDHVLGGGATPGEMILLGGEPGCGKSTLLAQVCKAIAPERVLYASGEENKEQIAIRHQRIDALVESIQFTDETDVDRITRLAQRLRVTFLIIDSLQTLRNCRPNTAPGERVQMISSTKILMDWARKTGIPTFLICHINKDLKLNGPKAVEHYIDVALIMRKDKKGKQPRHLSCLGKNRNGNPDNHGSFLMTERGLSPLPLGEEHGYRREEMQEDDMTPIAQELLYQLIGAGLEIDPGLRDRIADRLDLGPRSLP